MVDLAEENRRISEQVTSMSTQLMESISKQSELEEQLNHATKKVATLQDESKKYITLKNKYETLLSQNKEAQEQISVLKKDLVDETKLRNEAEDMVKQLEGEVEDLTASLFAEANNMVADARKEKHTTEILNRKLLEAVKEKDNALETMQAQLKHMKKVVEKMEPDSGSIYSSSNQRYSVMLTDSDNISLKKITTTNSFQSEIISTPTIVYSPNVSAIRYDLSLYTEFLKFIASLPFCKSIKDTSNDSKLLRRLNNDEVFPLLKLDNAPGISLWNRKGLVNAMMDGLVVIEPISGVNETYQIGYPSPSTSRSSIDKTRNLFSYPADSPPVATHTACALCGEDSSDNINHARMHMLKVQAKEENGKLTVQNSYPLCLWCLLRVRQTCDIYAFLRSLKLGTWNLESVTLKNGNVSEVTPFKRSNKSKTTEKSKRGELRSKRMSFMEGLGINATSSRMIPQVEAPSSTPSVRIGQPNSNIERAWVQLCKLRSMLHWAHLGVWSMDDSVSTKFGPVNGHESDDDSDTEIISANTNRLNIDANSAVSESELPTTKSSSIDSVISKSEESINSVVSDHTNTISAKDKDQLNKEEMDPDDDSCSVEINNDNTSSELNPDETKESIDIIGDYHNEDVPEHSSTSEENQNSQEHRDIPEEDDSSITQYADALDQK